MFLKKSQDHQAISYRDFQNILDRFVTKHGLVRAFELIKIFTIGPNKASKDKQRFISSFIIAATIDSFDLQEDQFFVSDTLVYRNALMVYVHLSNKYANISLAEIGRKISKTRRAAKHYYDRCDKILKAPITAKETIIKEKYESIERSVLKLLPEIQDKS